MWSAEPPSRRAHRPTTTVPLRALNVTLVPSDVNVDNYINNYERFTDWCWCVVDLFRECESVVRKRRRDGAVPEADIRTPPEPQSFPGDHQIEDSAEWERYGFVYKQYFCCKVPIQQWFRASTVNVLHNYYVCARDSQYLLCYCLLILIISYNTRIEMAQYAYLMTFRRLY